MQVVWQAFEKGVLLWQGEAVRLYPWGEPRPIYTRAFKGEVAAVAATDAAVYLATATRLHRLPRRPAEPAQTYELPTSFGRATKMLLHEQSGTTLVALLTERGALLRLRLPETHWDSLPLSRSGLPQGALYGTRVVLSDADGVALCVEVDSLKVLQRWQGGLGGVLDWAWHPQGRWVAGACADGLVKVWDPNTGKLLHAFAAHRLPPACVACHPQGSRLVSYGTDGLLFQYDLSTGRALLDQPLPLPRETERVLALRWAVPAQVWLFTGSAFVECQLPAGRWHTRVLQ